MGIKKEAAVISGRLNVIRRFVFPQYTLNCALSVLIMGTAKGGTHVSILIIRGAPAGMNAGVLITFGWTGTTSSGLASEQATQITARHTQ